MTVVITRLLSSNNNIEKHAHKYFKKFRCNTLLPTTIANKLNQLSVSMLKCICEYFDVNNEQLTVRRKAPYIALIGKLIQSCTCHRGVLGRWRYTNTRAMYHANKLSQLSVSMLKCICEYFDVNNEQLTVRRKAPYIVLIGKLIQSCTCHDQHSRVFRA